MHHLFEESFFFFEEVLNWLNNLFSLSGSRSSAGDVCKFHPGARASDSKPSDEGCVQGELRVCGFFSFLVSGVPIGAMLGGSASLSFFVCHSSRVIRSHKRRKN